LAWAEEDFADILKGYENYVFTDDQKPDRWRRTSGIHKVRDRLTLTIVRDLWLSRNQLASQLDMAPGRVLGDEAIIALAIAKTDDLEEIAKIIGWRTKLEAPPFGRWQKVIKQAATTALVDQPELKVASNNLPPLRVWKEKNPLGYARLTHAKFNISQRAKELSIPIENLVTPEIVRRICWSQPPINTVEHPQFVSEELIRLGAREWQILQVTEPICLALVQTEPLLQPQTTADETESSGSE
jgi:ribonuclease D